MLKIFRHVCAIYIYGRGESMTEKEAGMDLSTTLSPYLAYYVLGTVLFVCIISFKTLSSLFASISLVSGSVPYT